MGDLERSRPKLGFIRVQSPPVPLCDSGKQGPILCLWGLRENVFLSLHRRQVRAGLGWGGRSRCQPLASLGPQGRDDSGEQPPFQLMSLFFRIAVLMMGGFLGSLAGAVSQVGEGGEGGGGRRAGVPGIHGQSLRLKGTQDLQEGLLTSSRQSPWLLDLSTHDNLDAFRMKPLTTKQWREISLESGRSCDLHFSLGQSHSPKFSL